MRDHSQRYGLTARLSIGLAGLLFGAIIVGIFAADARQRYDQAIEAAKKDTLNSAEILAEHTRLTFRIFDNALREAEAIRRNDLQGAYPSPGAAHWALHHLVQTSPAMVAIGWTDAQGNLQAYSDDHAPPRSNISDMADFVAQRDHNDIGLFVSPPDLSAAGDRWLSAVSRRLTNPDGSFAGVVTASIDQSYFNKLYRFVDLGKLGSITLIHREGRVLAREPFVKGIIDKPIAAPRLPSLFRDSSGSFESVSPIDGVPRVVGFRAVPGLPLGVFVTRARSEVLAEWYHFLYVSGPVTLLIILGVLIGTLRLLRQTRLLAEDTNALANTAASFEQTNKRFHAALSSMSQGLCLFDAERRLVICNDRFREIYGYPEDLVRPGTPLKSILDNIVARGAKQGDMTVEEYIDGLRTNGAETVFNLDGRIISIIRTPTADGGWVATHEDITELRLNERKLASTAAELRLSNERFAAAISNLPQGFCVFDAEQRLVMSNRRFQDFYGYSDDLLQPGTSIQTFAADLAHRGVVPDMPLERLPDLAPHEQHRSVAQVGGRAIAILRQRTAEGGWVSTHEDITEQRRAEELLAEKAAELRQINERFDVAVSNMPLGICLFDAELRVVMFNERLRKIYDLPAGLLRPGLPRHELVHAMAAKGFVPDNMSVDEFADFVPEGSRQLMISESGRTISTSRAPIPGGGWIVTHEEITEQKHAERLLAESAAAVKRASERFEIAINNMPQGVCLFDAEQRVVVANARYAELYHLEVDQVSPGTTLQQILEYRREQGTNFAVAPEVYRSVNIRKSQEVQELADGRIVSISRATMSDGGWLTTHEDITERAQSARKIAYLAQHDMLTGLANRAQFTEKLDEVCKRHKRHGSSFTVLMLDLDRFKAVNDTLGHAAGDQLLKEVALRLKETLRETDVLARLGGDEFAIIQDGEAQQRQAAIAVSLRIVDVLGKPFEIDGQQVNIGTSIGIAFAPEHAADPGELLKCADLALYATKAAGRNDFRIFSPDMSHAEDAQRAGELRDAIARHEFELYYQRVVDAQTQEIRGVEALVRWRHPKRGLLGPDKFIPLAESTGQIVPLGEWILRQACADARSFPEQIKVAINISAVQFRKGNLFDAVLCALVQSGVSSNRIELDITETTLLDQNAAHLATMRQLKNLGVGIVLDDFGTGYASMQHLISFPFDKIKIDRTLTQEAPTRRDCAAAISSIQALACGLGIATTAEGVETTEQADYLAAAGVDLLQGYLFGRPVPLDQFSQDRPPMRDGMVA
ncbi:MAG TPA: PAS-domain containing protein [Bradyrhizobium sp.]|uniref:bifunctional diguanylate cyclase/phosphodiesterase n=1 Tax=Bradyrhizobium sp. TaxID=376 RepID=UPI002C7C5C3B|nr:PAS-domain containing protein [Bradyrhizobium sp.]HLZ04095.1 PAS-domain containing protein [Bradyrhizobium sp.]